MVTIRLDNPLVRSSVGVNYKKKQTTRVPWEAPSVCLPVGSLYLKQSNHFVPFPHFAIYYWLTLLTGFEVCMHYYWTFKCWRPFCQKENSNNDGQFWFSSVLISCLGICFDSSWLKLFHPKSTPSGMFFVLLFFPKKSALHHCILLQRWVPFVCLAIF